MGRIASGLCSVLLLIFGFGGTIAQPRVTIIYLDRARTHAHPFSGIFLQVVPPSQFPIDEPKGVNEQAFMTWMIGQGSAVGNVDMANFTHPIFSNFKVRYWR